MRQNLLVFALAVLTGVVLSAATVGFTVAYLAAKHGAVTVTWEAK